MTHVIAVDLEAERTASRARTEAETRARKLEARGRVLLDGGWSQSRAELEERSRTAFPNATDDEHANAVREAMRLQIEGRGIRLDAAEVLITAPEREPRPGRRSSTKAFDFPDLDAVATPAAPAPTISIPPAEPLPASTDEQQEGSMSSGTGKARRLDLGEKARVHELLVRELREDRELRPATLLRKIHAELGIAMAQGTLSTAYLPKALKAADLERERFFASVMGSDESGPPRASAEPSSQAEPVPAAPPAEAKTPPMRVPTESAAADLVVASTSCATDRGNLTASAHSNASLRIQLNLTTDDPALYSLLVGISLRALLQPEVARG